MPLMLTWNMQGGQGTYGSKWGHLSARITNPAQYGLPEAPSVIFLQECSDVPGMLTPPFWAPIPGAPPNVTRGSKNFGTFNNPRCYFVAHHNWGNANNRVSFAVLIRTNANQNIAIHQQLADDLSAQIVVHNPVFGAAGTRPIIGVTVGASTYYSMHAPSGVAAGFSRTYVTGMINASAFLGDYVIGGDFNCEPNNLYNPLHPIPNGVLNTSGQNTCGNNEYDYFTSSNNAINNTALNNVSVINLISDHFGVVATF